MSTATATDIGTQLANLCREGRNIEAIETLYADDILSIEAKSAPGCEQRTEGKEAVLAKNHKFFEMNEIHGGETRGPLTGHGNQFALIMSIDCTAKEGPMAGQRMQMEEVCLYTVEDGKIAREEFFYDCNMG